jgi:hypothetical protein
MLYAIFCYNREDVVGTWTAREDAAVMARLAQVEQGLAAAGRLGPVVRLLPTTTAVTLRKGRETVVIDGPFAETQEQLLGFYVVECEGLDPAIAAARQLAAANPGTGAYEIRPIGLYRPAAVHAVPGGAMKRTGA